MWDYILDRFVNAKLTLLNKTLTGPVITGGTGEFATLKVSTGAGTGKMLTSDADLSYQALAIYNQLYNSNFERWTRSGLTQGTGSGRQTDFNVTNIFTDTDGSSAGSWVGTDCTIADGGSALTVTQTGGTTRYAKYTLADLVPGKRYKFVCTIANGTGTLGWGDKIRVEQNGGTHIRSCRAEATATTYSI